ncbi:lysine transporter LysE [Cupriavidus taiwanensis]|uniref:LysE family translocator n=1 Tax=Cupriavidus taiwanensis TaxID=164546 RepID=UPI001F014F82|nr:LysE family translocator [Cupriavidus taiwanensis]ULX55238.1 lysine transporter LysE [Cupriavidus taiwanensis]
MPVELTAFNGVLGLVLTSAVLIAVPGPSIMFLVGQTIAVGRRNALRGVIGNAIGTYCVAVIVAMGIGSLLMRSDHVLIFIRLLGAVVLLGIGFQYLLFSRPMLAGGKSNPRKSQQSLVAGIIVGSTNPKALIMFGSIVPSFMGDGAESPIAYLLVFSLIPIALGLVIDAAWVAAAHVASSSTLFSGKRLRLFNIIGGGLMISMAILLAAEALH